MCVSTWKTSVTFQYVCMYVCMYVCIHTHTRKCTFIRTLLGKLPYRVAAYPVQTKEGRQEFFFFSQWLRVQGLEFGMVALVGVWKSSGSFLQ